MQSCKLVCVRASRLEIISGLAHFFETQQNALQDEFQISTEHGNCRKEKHLTSLVKDIIDIYTSPGERITGVGERLKSIDLI